MAFVSFIDWLQGGVKINPKLDGHLDTIQEKLAQLKHDQQTLITGADNKQALIPALDKQQNLDESHPINKQQTYLLFPGMFDDPKDMLNYAFSLYVESGGTANILLHEEIFEPGKTPEAIDQGERATRIVRDIRAELLRIAEENKKLIDELHRLAEESKQKPPTRNHNQRKKPGQNSRKKQNSMIDVNCAPKSQFPILVAYSSGAYDMVRAASLLQAHGQKSKVFILDEPEFSITKKDAFSSDQTKIQRSISDLIEIANVAGGKLGISDLANIGINMTPIIERLHIYTYDKRVTHFFNRLISVIQSNKMIDDDTRSRLIFMLKVAERKINDTVVNHDELEEPAALLEEIHVLMTDATKTKYGTTNTGGWEKWCKRIIDLDPDNTTGLKQQHHMDLPKADNADKLATLTLSHLRKELEPDTEFEANAHQRFTWLEADIEQAITEGVSPDTIERILLDKVRQTMSATVLKGAHKSNSSTAVSKESTVIEPPDTRDVRPDERLNFFGRYNPNGITAANRARSLSPVPSTTAETETHTRTSGMTLSANMNIAE